MNGDADEMRPRSSLDVSKSLRRWVCAHVLACVLAGSGPLLIWMLRGRPDELVVSLVLLVGPLAMVAWVLALFCVAVFLTWVFAISRDVRAIAKDARAIRPGLALGLMFIPGFNVYWLYHVLGRCAFILWAGLQTHGLPGAGRRTTRRLIGATTFLVLLLSVFLPAYAALVVFAPEVQGHLIRTWGYSAVSTLEGVLLLTAFLVYLTAVVLLTCTVHVLSRDADRLLQARARVDPSAVVPVERS